MFPSLTDVGLVKCCWPCPIIGSPGGSVLKNLPVHACQCKGHGFDPCVGKTPCRRAWQPTPVFLPGESHGQRSLVGYSPWGCKKQPTPVFLPEGSQGQGSLVGCRLWGRTVSDTTEATSQQQDLATKRQQTVLFLLILNARDQISLAL